MIRFASPFRGLSLSRGLAAAAFASLAATASAQSIDFSDPETRAAFREEVRAFLLEEPEIITEALQELERRRLEGALGALELLVDQGEIILERGAPEGQADLTLVEFTDYNCPFCRRAQPEVEAFIANDPNVRHIVKVLPYIGTDVSERAVLASLLQGDPEKTASLHVALMSVNGRLEDSRIFSAAEEVGLDVQRLQSDMGAQAIETRLARTVEVARALRIDGTPAFVFGPSVIEGEVLGGLRSSAELAAAAAAMRAR